MGFPFYTYNIHSRIKNLEHQSASQIESVRNELISHIHSSRETLITLYQKLLLFRGLGGVNEADFLFRVWSYCSQYNQDILVDTLLKQKDDGFFIELGAAHSQKISNTYFFEKYRGWKGLLIEANPDFIQDLQSVRKNAIIEQCAVSSEEGELVFCAASMLGGIAKHFNKSHKSRLGQEDFPEIKVRAYKLQTLLDKHQITEVDYLSLDTEGNELDVLQSIDYERVVIKIMTVEISYPERFSAIYHFLKEKGYRLYGKIAFGFVPAEDLLKENLDGSIEYKPKDITISTHGWYEGDCIFLHQSFIL